MDGSIKQRLKQGFGRAKKVLHLPSGDPQPSTPSTESAHLLTTPAIDSQSTFEPLNHTSVPPAVTSSNMDFRGDTQDPPAAPCLPASSPAERCVEREGWSELEVFAGVLSNTGISGPFKRAVDGILMCIGIFESLAESREDYRRLRTELNALFRDLAGYFAAPTPTAMTPSIANLALGIERELGLVQQKQQRSGMGGHVQAAEDADEILEYYRRIQGLLERLALNARVCNWQSADEQAAEIRLKGLPVSLAAYYKSAESSSLGRGGCTPNTRLDILEQMHDWAHDVANQRIYWLNGMAGTGKTTIAYSLCERLEKDQKLAASFFCSRQLPECRDVNRIVPTISYQLARFSTPFRYAIPRILEQHPDIYNRTLPEQFRQLIAIPLTEVQSMLPTDLIIVIDALDECEDPKGTRRILGVILSHARDLPVKFFVTNRPEPKVLNRMLNDERERISAELHVHELEPSTVRADIKTYLATSLGSRMSLSSDDLNILVERSGVVFVAAATIARYIGGDNFSKGPERLQEVLNGSGGSGEVIEQLYTLILDAAFSDPNLSEVGRAELKLLLDTVICAQEPISANVMAGLLGLGTEISVLAALRPLLSVLQVSDTTHTVATLHESFPDYLLDESRSGRFRCDAKKHNARLACLCLRHINTLSPPFNLCNIESSYQFDKDVPGLEHRVRETVSDSLLYACRRWGAHLVSAMNTQDLADILPEFLSTRLLLWMEVMNLKQCIYEGGRTLYYVQAWAQSALWVNEDIKELLRDAWWFIISFSSSPARLSTPHIYMSTLIFWPEDRPISKRYLRQRSSLITGAGIATSVRRTTPLAINTTKAIYSIACSPDGAYVATSSSDKDIHIWEVHTGEMMGRPLEGHAGGANMVIYSPDGAYIASGCSDNTIRIWDVRARQAVGQPLEGHTSAITSVAYSPDGAYLVSGSDDKTICVWGIATGQRMGQPLEGHTDGVTSVAYSPNAAYTVSGSYDFTIRIWDTHAGQAVGQPLEGHTGAIRSVAYSPDGQYILSSSYDNTLRIWDASTGQIIGCPLQGVAPAAYSPDGEYIVSGSHDHTMCIWDTRTRQMVGQLRGHANAITSVAYSPDSAYIVSGSYDTTMRIWDVRTARTIDQSFQGHSSAVTSVAFSPGGASIASSSCDGTTRIWDTRTGQPIGQSLHRNTNDITPVAYSPAGAYIASGSDENNVCIWDVNTGQVVGQLLEGHTGAVTSIAYSPDGAYLVSGSDDKTIRLWDARTCRPITQPMEGHADVVTSVAYSQGGLYIVSGSGDMTIRLWNARTSQAIGRPLEGHTDTVTSVAYSPDDACIVSGSNDKTIRIWDALTGHTIGQPLQGHTWIIRSVAYSPDGAYVISGSGDKTICIWDARTGQVVGQPLQGHTGAVVSVAYSQDGAYIVSGSDDGTMRIWDARSAVLMGDAHVPRAAWKMEDDGWVVTNDSQLFVWVPPDLRHVLLLPPSITVISRDGSLPLSLDYGKIGKYWQNHT